MVADGGKSTAGGGENDTGDAVREFDAGEMAPLGDTGVVERLEIPNRAMAAAVESALVVTAGTDGLGAAGFTGIGGFGVGIRDDAKLVGLVAAALGDIDPFAAPMEEVPFAGNPANGSSGS